MCLALAGLCSEVCKEVVLEIAYFLPQYECLVFSRHSELFYHLSEQSVAPKPCFPSSCPEAYHDVSSDLGGLLFLVPTQNCSGSLV